MSEDELAVRKLVANWFEATKKGDLSTILSLLADDVVFMTCGQEPFGRDAFAASFRGMTGKARIDGNSEIQEIRIAGDFAYLRSFLDITMTPSNGDSPVRRSGHTLTILRRDKGVWLLARDANLLTAHE